MSTLPLRKTLFQAAWLRRWLHFLCTVVAFGAVATLPATTVVPPQFSELVDKSDYIVRAVVKSVTAELRSDGANRRIITKVELDVREVISGTPPQPLILEMLGGKVGKDEMRVAGTPRFQVGDEDILFVRGNGKQFFPLVALFHGRYPIKRDAQTGEEYVARGDGTPLTSEQEVARPMLAPASGESRTESAAARPMAPALTPADFVNRIKAVGVKGAEAQQNQP